MDIIDHGSEKKEKREKHRSALKKGLILMAEIHLVRQEIISTIIKDIDKATLEYCVQFWKNMINKDKFK